MFKRHCTCGVVNVCPVHKYFQCLLFLMTFQCIFITSQNINPIQQFKVYCCIGNIKKELLSLEYLVQHKNAYVAYGFFFNPNTNNMHMLADST